MKTLCPVLPRRKKGVGTDSEPLSVWIRKQDWPLASLTVAPEHPE